MSVSRGRILIVDDDPDIVEVLGDQLEAEGFEVVTASNGVEGLQRIRMGDCDVVLLDLQIPEMDGMAVLRQIEAERLETTVVVLTAYGTIQRAVQAMKAGAFDVLSKPFDPENISVIVGKAIEQERLRREHAYFREEAAGSLPFLISDAPPMREIQTVARKAAESTVTVLLLGESGTGKEVLARAIHYWSPRRERPFVAVNCVALPESLLESELFGHEKGAFTGAHGQRKGKFEIAKGGTIFLDEIGATKPDLQLKLLRVLQEGEFERVGGSQVLKADVRVIAATNRDVEQAIKDGAFLMDLYYRLNVVSLTLPPLRERMEDIPALACFFLRKYAHEAKRKVVRISDDAMAYLMTYPWPGNGRELENAIERAVVLGTGAEIRPEDLPEQVVGIKRPSGQEARRFHASVADDASSPSPPGNLDEWLRAILERRGGDIPRNLLEIAEEMVIRAVVAHVKGNKSQAAKLLGIDRKKVERRMAKYGIV